jgi:hypothetical protein
MDCLDEGDCYSESKVSHDSRVGFLLLVGSDAGEMLEDFGGLWCEHTVSGSNKGVERFASGFANGLVLSLFGTFVT